MGAPFTKFWGKERAKREGGKGVGAGVGQPSWYDPGAIGFRVTANAKTPLDSSHNASYRHTQTQSVLVTT